MTVILLAILAYLVGGGIALSVVLIAALAMFILEIVGAYDGL